jgi:hypothetical protein
MVVSKRDHTDPTTSLLPGDHPFLARESNVDYRTAKSVDKDRILSDMGMGTCVLQANVDQGVLKRVQAGLLASERTVNHVKEQCRLVWQPKKV